ncbi:reverse transcriptase domain-containing protein [Ectobacillus funiculus]|uniref:Reverse transcriptase domain-containing protein n=1 Tax=Ectobacillus funiculus TaxID=137993 RepID=A0ABV5WCE6_9BACI
MKQYAHLGELVRYADDLVILCRTKQEALESICVLQGIMAKLDLTIHREKSKLINMWDDTTGFDFLGFHHRKFPKKNKGGSTIYTLSHIPCFLQALLFCIKQFQVKRR